MFKFLLQWIQGSGKLSRIEPPRHCPYPSTDQGSIVWPLVLQLRIRARNQKAKCKKPRAQWSLFLLLTHINKSPSYRLLAKVKNNMILKAEDFHNWIEELTGTSIGTNFQLDWKDGIILWELINRHNPLRTHKQATARLIEEGQWVLIKLASVGEYWQLY